MAHGADRGRVIRLLWGTGLATLGLSVSESFVSPYLWLNRLSSAAVMAFSGVEFVAMAAVFLVAERRGGSARAWLTAGTALLLVFLVGVAAGGPALGRVAFGLGVAAGVGYGCYWQGFYMAAAEDVGPADRDRFNARLGVLEQGAALLGPLAGAGIIEAAGRAGYAGAFAVSAAGLVPVLVWRPASRRRHRPTRPADAGREWVRLLWAHGARGFYEGVLMAAPGLALFEVTRSAAWVGAFASAVAAAGMAGYRLAEGLARSRSRARLTWLGAAGVLAAALALAALPAGPGVAAFGVVTALAAPWQKVPIEAATLDVAARFPESLAWITARKEAVLNGSRAAGLLVLAGWLLGGRGGWGGIRATLLFVPVPAFLAAWVWARRA